MMKSLKYLLISTFLLCVSYEALACWDPWYDPSGYYMYRVYEKAPAPKMEIGKNFPDIEANCIGWQKLSSDSISLEDIYKVIYTIPVKELQKICDSRWSKHDNKFIEWIVKKDRALLDCILLAKTNEYIRVKHNSRWYYPTMDIGIDTTLEEVAEKALSAKDARLRDRHLLQAVRALFSMQRYEECVALWNKEVSHLPDDNLMRRLIQPYIAGAEFRVGDTTKAMEYFAHIGDVESLRYCAKQIGDPISTAGALELVCKYAPNAPYIAETLQAYIREVEPEGCVLEFGSSEWLDSQEKERFNTRVSRAKWLCPFCIKMAQNSEVENPAMWYYTAAFLSDLIGETNKASQYLSLAEKVKSTPYIAESIKVMRIYLDAKLSKYDSTYEAKLFEQLKWLDSQIANNITDKVCIETAHGYHINSGTSYYYWNDMLRRIMLAEVCPRMVKMGKTTRALQLANMADNRLLNIVNKRDFVKCIINWSEGSYDYEEVKDASMPDFRYARYKFNCHDYSNHFFELADSLGVNTVKRYVQNVNTPQSEFDRYLNGRGYTGSDYLNDIVGTQCLREMRYGEAVKYLSKVSDAYNRGHLNVIMQYDPFSVEREYLSSECDTRLEFAQKMYSLEQKIKTTTNPNEKAMSMFRFAIGLRNSFDRCWPLTQYYRGECYWGCVIGIKRDWENDQYAKSATQRVKQMIASASSMATDDEVAAEIQYQMCNFKTVAEKYPNTHKGELVRGKCDKLIDYHAERHETRPSNWYDGDRGL